jgi:hypothetical protein
LQLRSVAAEADLEARLAAQMQVAETAAVVAAPDGQVQETAAALLPRDRGTLVARPELRPQISMALAAAVPELLARTDREVRERVATVLPMTAPRTQLVRVAVRRAAWRRRAAALTRTTTTAELASALLVRLQPQIRAAVAAVPDQTLLPETRLAEQDHQAS